MAIITLIQCSSQAGAHETDSSQTSVAPRSHFPTSRFPLAGDACVKYAVHIVIWRVAPRRDADDGRREPYSRTYIICVNLSEITDA